MRIYIEAESNANKFALACFGHVSSRGAGRPRAPDTTGGTCLQALRLAGPRREPYFCPAGQISQKPGGAWRASQGGDGCPVCTGGWESATVSRQIGSLSRKGLARNAVRMAVEPRARFLPWEKVLRFHGKSIHISPPQRRQMYACRISMTEDTVLCFMLPVQELFMKIAGAVANCRFYAKDCKSIPRVVQS